MHTYHTLERVPLEKDESVLVPASGRSRRSAGRPHLDDFGLLQTLLGLVSRLVCLLWNELCVTSQAVASSLFVAAKLEGKGSIVDHYCSFLHDSGRQKGFGHERAVGKAQRLATCPPTSFGICARLGA
eukprot:gnl/Spiro4/17331_TR9232_c1_g1_i1.p1 gnl/Spiro4/17331_TR9232_c1_g1~~gnl/Spiro4/17331_TR9232_c1_g1_i1.p1  ORF type:complete len:128 (-),score=5.40 gnl/Spiro4/17331_TR9232_c1_g1_i1:102-485(-)